MESKSNNPEENIIRLIQASFSRQARPDAGLHGEMLHRLREEIRTNRAGIEFPNGVLVTLTGILTLMAVWLMIQTTSGQSIMTSPTLTIMAMVLILNLALVPVASLIIVIRRRHVKTS